MTGARPPRIAPPAGTAAPSAPTTSAGFAIVLVGAGNIGSHAVPLLARLRGLGRLTIVDRDAYEPKNLAGQAIASGDVGKAKASVQAARARRVAAELDVRAVVGDLATLPFGVFHADLVLGALDSRAARQRLGEIAFRLGAPYLDAGVNADALLARVNVYDSRTADAPCVACGWGQADYDAIEHVQPCQMAAVPAPSVAAASSTTPPVPSVASPAPTNAPAALGALAAALLALECEKWIRGREDRLAPGTEVMLDAAAHTHHRTRERRNPACRFDHERWAVEHVDASPATLSLDALLGRAAATPGDAVFAAAGQRFVTQVACAACGATRPLVRLASALRPRDRTCLACGQPTAPRGWDLTDRLDVAALGAAARRRPLRALGLRSGEVVAITRAADVRHFELS